MEKHEKELVLVKIFHFIHVVSIIYSFLWKSSYIAYLPKGGRLTGLSKLARVIDTLAKRPQLQEESLKCCRYIIMEELQPYGV